MRATYEGDSQLRRWLFCWQVGRVLYKGAECTAACLPEFNSGKVGGCRPHMKKNSTAGSFVQVFPSPKMITFFLPTYVNTWCNTYDYPHYVLARILTDEHRRCVYTLRAHADVWTHYVLARGVAVRRTA